MASPRKKFNPRERHSESGVSLDANDGIPSGGTKHDPDVRAADVVSVPWSEVLLGGNRSAFVPDCPSSLDGAIAPSLNRQDLVNYYGALLLNGQPADIKREVDLRVLVEVWDEILVPESLREAWRPLVDTELNGS
jgi:hypothetical protein